MITRAEFDLRMASVESLSTRRHAHAVEGMIRWIRPSRVLEIGAYQGFMSCVIARALQECGDGRFVILDDFSDYRTSPDMIRANLLKVETEDRLEGIRIGNSIGIDSLGPFDMVLIDADHTAFWAKADTDFALRSGAYCLAWHDSHDFGGVRQAVDGIRSLPNWGVIEMPFDAGYAIAIERWQRDDPVVPSDRSHV